MWIEIARGLLLLLIALTTAAAGPGGAVATSVVAAPVVIDNAPPPVVAQPPRQVRSATPVPASTPVQGPNGPWMTFRLGHPVPCYALPDLKSKVYSTMQIGATVVATLLPSGWSAVEECGYVPTQVLLGP